MKITIKDRLEVSGRDLVCSINIEPGRVHLISGENGVGKTSLITFLKMNQDEYFPGKKLTFVDQFPLIPLNSISFNDLKLILGVKQADESPLFKELEKLTKSFENQSIKSLSGGQNQIIKILIALYLSGDIFFFDEPLQYLDQEMRTRVKKLFIKLKELGKTLIIVEHSNEFDPSFIDKHISFKQIDRRVEVRDGI